ncbi:MAG: glycosyltransferase, partial [Aurantibacter sp.]
FFKNENYHITIASTADNSMVKESDFEGIELASIRLNHSSFDEFVSKLCPDIVLFDRFMAEEQFGWRVAERAPNALRILDTEDLHSLRKAREQALATDQDFSTELWLNNELTKREIASIYRSDLSLIISSYEIILLQPIIKEHESLLLHLPFMVGRLDELAMEKWKPFEKRKDFVFIGFGGHAPNVDAISYLNTAIWPVVRAALPAAKVNIYGGNFPEEIHQMNDPATGFLVKGWVEDAKTVIESARVMLAPLRFGAGLKGKLLDAMRYGTPSVTTSIGAEGMHGTFDWTGKICEGPKVFADAAVALYGHKEEWERCQKNAVGIVNSIYDRESLGTTLGLRIKSLRENLTEHRAKNFIGAMFRHQTLASTKYMSKWIEEKNRK